MSSTFIFGGARSGKSRRAEMLATASGLEVCYIATAPAFIEDAEWQQRIHKHQHQRPTAWKTIEEELHIAAIMEQSTASTCLLLDCLGLWLSNLMYADKDIAQESSKLCCAIQACPAKLIIVSNEVGMGLVPETKLGRAFRDELGILNQRVAQVSTNVEWIAAGIPLHLKSAADNQQSPLK